MTIDEIKADLRRSSSSQRAAVSQRYFKTGPGEYAEGDSFLGISTPDLRKIARRYTSLTDELIVLLLQSPIHEERSLALFVLVSLFSTADAARQTQIFDLYLQNTRHINNWDLVDLSAPTIVGSFLLNRNKDILYKLAGSTHLWERRISIVSTYTFIRNHSYSDTLRIAHRLLSDNEDLIHKAVGWMLREIGKRDLETEERFLRKRYKKMPRTMLRYAIERFPEKKRQLYLKGQI